MSTIVTRAGKGSPLTNTEVDANFTNLNDDKLESSSYTANDVLDKIKTVDGTGSGLDADLLDGNQATDFATSAQGSLADSAVQPGDNVSDLTNDAGYLTSETYTGTVTSVAATVPTGLAVSGSPITSSGTLAISFDTGYAIPTTASQTNWDTAYGWGDHASAGYLTSYTETDPVVGAITGIVKADGAGNISAAVAGTDYLTSVQAGDIDSQTATDGYVLTADGAGNAAWEAPSAGSSYTDSDVDTHLNTGTASSGEVLSWNGSDYDWVAQSGGGGGALTIDNKTGAYTVVAGDLGKIINCTSGTFDVSLTAAATLGAGFEVTIWNTGTGAITINPDGSETIDGVATLVLRRGEGMQIVCDGTNWQTGYKKVMRGYAENFSNSTVRNIVNGSDSIAIGRSNTASGIESLAIGCYNANATNYGSIAIGHSTTAGAARSVALGVNSGFSGSVTATGAGAMALGGSRASGTDSFAAAIANNTSSYGATGANSVAMGQSAKATSAWSFACGRNSQSTSSYSVVLGGYLSTASKDYAYAFGHRASSDVIGKYAYGVFTSADVGTSQGGYYVLALNTTDATASPLVTNGGTNAGGTTNQIILPNNSAYAFHGTIVARQQASQGTACAAWKIEGLIRREGSAGTTVLVNSATTVLDNTPGWGMALSADTTNGGLKIEVTGAAATNIRWVATVHTSEVTYA